MFPCTTPTTSSSAGQRHEGDSAAYAFRDIDKLGLLNNVPTLNFHPHLPHYELIPEDTKAVHVLARQPIDLDRPHPFTAACNTEFNSLLWMPPNHSAPETSCCCT